mgnify:CR=1 FL=1
MGRIGRIWMMIGRYLLPVMLGGVIVWACNSAGISVYADDGETPDGAELIRFDFHKSVNQEVGILAGIPGFFTYFYEGKEYHYGFRFDRNGTGPETESLVRHMSGHLIRLFIMTLQGVRSRITVRQQQEEEGCLQQGEMVKSLKPGRIKERTKENLRQIILCMGRASG